MHTVNKVHLYCIVLYCNKQTISNMTTGNLTEHFQEFTQGVNIKQIKYPLSFIYIALNISFNYRVIGVTSDPP